eukprot:748018-Hanusia_phi.AAC.1
MTQPSILRTFSDLQGGGKTIEDVFKALDTDESGFLEEEEVAAGMSKFGVEFDQANLQEIRQFLNVKEQEELKVDLETFRQLVDSAPSASGGLLSEVSSWLVNLHLYQDLAGPLERFLARHFPRTSKFTEAVMQLEEEDMVEIVRGAESGIVKRLRAEVEKLREEQARMNETEAGGGGGGNSKFGGGAGVTMVYANLSEFHKGLESAIGLPNPRHAAGMRDEHCSRADSKQLFTASNYGISSTPQQEWEYVVSPEEGKEYPGELTAGAEHGRTRQRIEDLLKKDKIVKAQLSAEELIGLRLYTGPMFVKYNAVLRGFPQKVLDDMHGNRYVTTLHAIVSGIRKLAQVEKIPEGRCVYRGLGGMLLPKCFYEKDESGCMGGVEK